VAPSFGAKWRCTGERQIHVEEAAIVQRIFRDYSAGMSPKAIATRLNGEGISPLDCSGWNPSTIHGN
jgi:site-specific DNA recombinase